MRGGTLHRRRGYVHGEAAYGTREQVCGGPVYGTGRETITGSTRIDGDGVRPGAPAGKWARVGAVHRKGVEVSGGAAQGMGRKVRAAAVH